MSGEKVYAIFGNFLFHVAGVLEFWRSVLCFVFCVLSFALGLLLYDGRIETK